MNSPKIKLRDGWSWHRISDAGSCRLEVWGASADDTWTAMDRCAHIDDLARAVELANAARETMR